MQPLESALARTSTTFDDNRESLIETLLALGFVEDFGGLPEGLNALPHSLLDGKKLTGGALDITTQATIAQDKLVKAELVLKQKATVACLDIFQRVLQVLDANAKVTLLVEDGTQIEKIPSTVARIEGQARALLMGERLALNLVQRLCGIATLTRQYTALAGPRGIKILDTRKTTPGLRALEKRAVLAGGGTNHRMGLFDAVLIKDNHIQAAGSITAALAQVERYLAEHPQIKLQKPVEVEVASIEQLDEALKLGVEAVLLDNMKPEMVKEAIQQISTYKKNCFVEVSGGVNLSNLETYLIEGVNAISIGALTHSATNIDLSLEF